MADRPEVQAVRAAEIGLHRDIFVRTLIRHLAGTLQDVVGLDEASGFISVVGQQMGEEINQSYRTALGVPRLTKPQVAEVLVDLKRRIEGDFSIVEEDEEKIVLVNRACPFGDRVHDRPALCMMTSNVFGHIVSDNLGFAKVVIDQAIARGDAGCRIVVYLTPDAATADARGREYYKA